METDGLTVLNPNVDFRQVPPIHQKRTIAFVNHFIMNTVNFLNNFAESCEIRLMEFQSKIEKVEASLMILEAQLSSIASLKNESVSTVAENNDEVIKVDLPEVNDNEVKDNGSHDNVITSGSKACEDPRYERFFKMVQFGVPHAAVKLKMELEGINPNILDNPNKTEPTNS